MRNKKAIDIDELLFHDDAFEEEGDDPFDENESTPESESNEEEEDLLPELEIGNDGHIRPRRKRGRREEDEESSPAVLDWDE